MKFATIKNYPNYMVSDTGIVRSLRRMGTAGGPVKQRIDHRGYMKATLSESDLAKEFFVHRLVAAAFLPDFLARPQVNHKNGQKTDNRLENLEMCTPKQNTEHADRTGLRKVRAEDNGNSKLTWPIVRQMRAVRAAGTTFKKLASMFGVSTRTANIIIRNLSWTV